MANAYHNLAGWLRDVRAILSDRTELADSYYWALRDVLVTGLQLVEGDGDDGDLEDPESGGVLPDELIDDGDDEVAVQRPRDRRGNGADRLGAAARQPNLVAGPAAVASNRARRVQAAGAASGGRPADLARAGRDAAGVKEKQRIEQPRPFAIAGAVPMSSGNVPRGTRKRKPTKRVSKRTRKGA